MQTLLIIGAGPMGLAAAFHGLKAGYDVTIVEAAKEPGGMAAHMNFGGLSIERYYHFCCTGDTDTLELLTELGIADAMKWRKTSMGYFVDGKLHKFGDPFSLLKFSPLTFLEKLRYGAMVWLATQRKDWSKLDQVSAKEWISTWCGEQVYKKLWRPLLHLKFYQYEEQISAAWVWQRIKRLGKSRQSILHEKLGYLEGGSQTLVNRLVEEIAVQGGKLVLDSPVKHILSDGKSVQGIQTANGQTFTATHVLSTIPLPHATPMLERDLPELKSSYEGFKNVGVACVMHKLKKSVSEHFWVNISDRSISIPGIVEFSNLRPTETVIVYVPYYMPADHPKFSWPDKQLLNESFAYLQQLNPSLTQSDRIDGHVGKLRYAQPVCDVNFASKIPNPKTPINGLWIADTSFYYPEDRGVSESVRYAKQLVCTMSQDTT